MRREIHKQRARKIYKLKRLIHCYQDEAVKSYDDCKDDLQDYWLTEADKQVTLLLKLIKW